MRQRPPRAEHEPDTGHTKAQHRHLRWRRRATPHRPPPSPRPRRHRQRRHRPDCEARHHERPTLRAARQRRQQQGRLQGPAGPRDPRQPGKPRSKWPPAPTHDAHRHLGAALHPIGLLAGGQPPQAQREEGQMQQGPQRPQRRRCLAPCAERGHAARGHRPTRCVSKHAPDVEPRRVAPAAARQGRAWRTAHHCAMRRGRHAHRKPGEDQRCVH